MGPNENYSKRLNHGPPGVHKRQMPQYLNSKSGFGLHKQRNIRCIRTIFTTAGITVFLFELIVSSWIK